MKGKIPAASFKAMAVVSALAIGGGYVAWRQMEADQRERAERAKPPLEEEETTLIVGSKSIDAVLRKEHLDEIDKNWEAGHEKLPVDGEEEESKDQELLPSSKIGILKLPQKETPKKKDPKLLPGSKSVIVIPVEPDLPE